MRRNMSWTRARVAVLALVAASVVAIAASGGRVAGGADDSPQAKTRALGSQADEKAIRATADAYTKAFNAGDSKAIAALWSSDGEHVDESGRMLKGREAIEKEFAAFFAEHHGLALEISVESIRFLSPDIAIENGTARAISPLGSPASSSRYTAVHARQDGKWLMVSSQESPQVPTSNYDYLREVEWLVGDWTVAAGENSLAMKCEWTADKNFLTRTYTTKEASRVTGSGMQVIGWDPTVGAIRSWHFNSEGGFGSDLWTREGKRWVIDATGVLRDGSQTEATNLLTQLDDGCFTWQSVRRSIAGARLPDTAELKICRTPSKR
jgi:uncharacterized protein (TIGR02246 family)